MINHLRTLLMNVEGEPSFNLELGEEIVPSDYRVVTLPGELQRVRNILFGARPDRAMLNYRLRQYLPLLHETDLVEFVTDLDNRISYSFEDDPFFDDALFRPQVTQIAGSNVELYFLGEPTSPDASGRMRREWQITINSGNTVEIRQLSPLVAEDLAYTISNGLSNLVDVPQSTYKIRFQEPQIGNMWRVVLYSRPTIDLGEIHATLKTLGEPTFIEIFSTTSQQGQTEPFKTFRNLWEEHHELAYSLGGLLLAVAYKTDELR